MWHKIKKIIIFILIIMVFSMLYSHFRIDVTKYDVISSELPKSFDGLKIVQLSDLHNRNISDRIVNVLSKEKPHIVVMTGDMINYNTKDYEQIFNLCKLISKKYLTYYIVGNHEQQLESDDYTKLVQGIRKNGVIFVENEKIEYQKDEDYINIYGIGQDLDYYFDNLTLETISSFLGESTKTDFNLLLAHNPLHFEIYEKWGSDLTLSGHVHGGAIRIPFLGGVLSPDISFFPKYNAGLYEINDSKLIVSRGLGYGSFPIRMFNPFEINVITLRAI